MESGAATGIAEFLGEIHPAGRVLLVGTGKEELVRLLSARGFDTIEFPPQDAADGPGDQLMDDGAFDAVVVLTSPERLRQPDFAAAASELRRICRATMLVVLGPPANVEGLPDRRDWETALIQLGFRKHPLGLLLAPYNTLDDERGWRVLAFEPLPRGLFEAHPLESLRLERDLHMDMLREGGRRSDAHLARYQFARGFVSPGARVLDGACGLGYGSVVLTRGIPDVALIGLDLSESAIRYATAFYGGAGTGIDFRAGDVCDLHRISDGELDLVVSFETIEHLRDPELFIAQIRRILRPGGRFICSVPNLWVDDKGNDPSPYHFHVFDRSAIEKLVGAHLDIEEVHRQNAGGGMKSPALGRKLERIRSHDAVEPHDAEWLIVVARKPHATAMVDHAGDSGQRLLWESVAQEGEFRWHRENQWRQSDQFMVDTGELFRHFHFGAGGWEGKRILDVGCGSRLRTKYFQNARLIALDPLADRYRKEIPWCDLDTAELCLSVPCESHCAALDGTVDLAVCINVLDHTYDPEAILSNVARYLAPGGEFLLSVDLHDHSDDLHPVHLTEDLLRRLVAAAGFRITRAYSGLSAAPSYGHGIASTFVMKREFAGSAPGGKRIWCLTSNGNHAKILAPVARRLSERGHSVLFFSPDRYYRQGSGPQLASESCAWDEVPSATPDGNWYESTWEVREALAEEGKRGVEALFHAERPDLFVCGNDCGPIEQFMLRRAEAEGVRTCLVQEGLPTPTPPFDDKGERWLGVGEGGCEDFCLWGEAFEKHFALKQSASRLVVTGNPRYDALPRRGKKPRSGVPPTILVIGQAFAHFGHLSQERERDVYGHLFQLLGSRPGGRILFKTHPQQRREVYESLRGTGGIDFAFATEEDSLRALAGCDAMVTISSTVAVEAILMGVPTLMTPYLIDAPLPQFGSIPVVYASDSDVRSAILDPRFPENVTLRSADRDAAVRMLAGPFDGTAADRIADVILDSIRGGDVREARPSFSVLCVQDDEDLSPLRLTVATLLRSGDPRIETVVVDVRPSASDRESPARPGLDPRLKWESLPGGTAADAFRRGCAVARGAFLIRIFPGAHLFPRWAERMALPLSTENGAVLAYPVWLGTDKWRNIVRWTPHEPADDHQTPAGPPGILSYACRRAAAEAFFAETGDGGRRDEETFLASLKGQGRAVIAEGAFCADRRPHGVHADHQRQRIPTVMTDSVEIAVAQAEECIRQNDLMRARTMLQGALEHAPGSIDALNDLAVVEYLLLRFEEALRIVDRVLELDPQNEIARHNKECWHQEISAGLADAGTASSPAPGASGRTDEAEHPASTARSLVASGEVLRALDLYLEMAVPTQGNPDVLNGLGEVFRLLGKNALASRYSDAGAALAKGMAASVPRENGEAQTSAARGSSLVQQVSGLAQTIGSLDELGEKELVRLRDAVATLAIRIDERLRRLEGAVRPTVPGIVHPGGSPLMKHLTDAKAPWLLIDPPATMIPGMITAEEKQYYLYITQFYSGTGAVLELGPWLGCSTSYIVNGLRGAKAFRNRKVHVVDDFVWRSSWMDGYYGEADRPAHHASFRKIFDRYAVPIQDSIVVHANKITDYDGNESLPPLVWAGGPIELAFIDCGRSLYANDAWWSLLVHHFIPGKTLLVLQDWQTHKEVPVRWYNQMKHFTESKGGALEIVHELSNGGVATFLYHGS